MGAVLETQARRTGDPALIVAVDAAASFEVLEDLGGGRAIEPDDAGKLGGLDR
jgi:hypothetical protein